MAASFFAFMTLSASRIASGIHGLMLGKVWRCFSHSVHSARDALLSGISMTCWGKAKGDLLSGTSARLEMGLRGVPYIFG
jgi:hypothetical protein